MKKEDIVAALSKLDAHSYAKSVTFEVETLVAVLSTLDAHSYTAQFAQVMLLSPSQSYLLWTYNPLKVIL